jgi:hypothetical protein
MSNLYVLAITVWLTGNPTAPAHVVHSEPMPVLVCEALADKLNIPLLFPKQVSAQAVCVPAQ